jgi:hypothetical protein
MKIRDGLIDSSYFQNCLRAAANIERAIRPIGGLEAKAQDSNAGGITV